MVVFDRIVIVVMLALLVMAAMVIFVFYGGAGQLQTFANARNICESAFAGSCFNTGKAPVTWTMPTQNKNGSEISCYELLNCTCTGSGKAGKTICVPVDK